jgi:hypothetical protein
MGISELVFWKNELQVSVQPLNSNEIQVETNIRNICTNKISELCLEKFESKTVVINKLSLRRKLALAEAIIADGLFLITTNCGVINLSKNADYENMSLIGIGLTLFSIGIYVGGLGLRAHTQEDAVRESMN